MFSLTLDEYIDTALKGNISIKSKKNSTEKSELSRLQSYSGYLPETALGGSFYYSRNNEEKLDADGASADPSLASIKNPLFTRKISISLPVFTGGSRVVGNLIAQENKEISVIDTEYEKMSVEASAVAAYFQAYITQENIALAERSVKSASENLRTAKLLLDEGRTTELAYLNFELMLSRREIELESYRLEMKKNIAEMSRIAAVDIEFDKLERVAVPSIEEEFSGKNVTAAYDEQKALLMNNSLVLSKLKKLTTISEYREIMTWAPFMPVLSFNYTHDFGSAEDHPFNSTYLYDDDTVTLNFSWNLFKGFSDGIEWRKSVKDKVSAGLAYLEARNGQMYSLKAVLSSIYSLIEQKKTAVKSTEIAKKALEQSRLEYENGKALYLDILNAENSYYEAMKTLVVIENSIYNSYFQLHVITGAGDKK